MDHKCNNGNRSISLLKNWEKEKEKNCRGNSSIDVNLLRQSSKGAGHKPTATFTFKGLTTR